MNLRSIAADFKSPKAFWEFIVRHRSNPLFVSAICVFLGLLAGAIALLVANYNPITAFGVIFRGIFESTKSFSYTLVYATPILLTGLSFAFCAKAGLFNIGAEGQFVVGGLATVLVGAYLPMPAYIHIPLCLLAGITAGALWGVIAGALKVYFNVNEVISTIMLNWIALFFNNFIVHLHGIKRPESEGTRLLLHTARLEFLADWKYSQAGNAWRSAHHFLGGFISAPLSIAPLLAILVAIAVWFVMQKTRFGISIRAAGEKPEAAKAAGMKPKYIGMMTMLISGCFAGLAGALNLMGGNSQSIQNLANLEGYGFDGIAVSLIGGGHAIGMIFSSFLVAGLRYGGAKIQPALGAPSEIINIMIGAIIFCYAFSFLFKNLLSRARK